MHVYEEDETLLCSTGQDAGEKYKEKELGESCCPNGVSARWMLRFCSLSSRRCPHTNLVPKREPLQFSNCYYNYASVSETTAIAFIVYLKVCGPLKAWSSRVVCLAPQWGVRQRENLVSYFLFCIY